MLKFVPELTDIVMEEIPGRVTLALEISNCAGNCPGCHSPFLKNDIGEELSFERVEALLKDNFGVNCILLLGEGRDPEALRSLGRRMKDSFKGVETALYSGRPEVEDDIFEIFDYVKVGPYIEALGPLNSPDTNQRLYHHREDITSVFWRGGKA